ncbi:MAG: ABC transporter substrate-binding protein [Candidatus Omnitrophica bacterium]|nr:ABC transporter substrate-binding protein [Candidatus Omnitrophota bacterium]
MFTGHGVKFNKQILSIALLVLVMFLGSCGKEPQNEKVYRVGVLFGLGYFAPVIDGFKEKMAELGYIEGKNIVYDIQKVEFPIGNQHLIQKFLDDKVDLIFPFPTEATMETQEVTKGLDIPVVFACAAIEDMNIVESVSHPGGHTTGVRYPGPDISIKRFEIMLELVPESKVIWIPYQRGYPIVVPQLKALRPVAEAAGVRLIEFPADDAAEIQAELDRISQLDDIGFDAIMAVAEPLFVTPDAFEVIGKFSYEHNIPAAGAIMIVGGYGSLFGVHVNSFSIGKQVAVIVDKVFKGIPVGTIPVVSPEYLFEINYKVAEKLGIEVPEGLLSRADKIIR